jgi:hypothetical protein
MIGDVFFFSGCKLPERYWCEKGRCCDYLFAHAYGASYHNACLCPHWCCSFGITQTFLSLSSYFLFTDDFKVITLFDLFDLPIDLILLVFFNFFRLYLRGFLQNLFHRESLIVSQKL